MAIVKMNKFTLLTFESHKEELLKNLQRFEEVEFINLKDEDKEEFQSLLKDSEAIKVSELQGELAKIKFCLDYLGKYSVKPSAIKALKEGKKTLTFDQLETEVKSISYKDAYNFIKEQDSKIVNLKNKISKLTADIDSLVPWIKFDASFSDLNKLSNCSSYVGCVPKNVQENFLERFNSEITNSYVELIEEVRDEANLIIIAHKDSREQVEEILRNFAFARVSLGFDGNPREIIKEAKAKILELQKEKRDLEELIKLKSDLIDGLEVSYEYISNELIKHGASDNFLKTDNVTVIEGWVPREDAEELQKVIEKSVGKNYYFEMEEAEKLEIEEVKIPIKLRNNDMVKSFESITEMYSLPHYSEIDPTPMVMAFYLVFFAMMVADVGYAAVIFVISLLALKLFNLDGVKKQFMKFFLYLSIPTAIVGALYGSYFGDAIKIPGVINPSSDVITLLLVSMGLGLVQLFVGIGIKGYMFIREGKYLDALYDTLPWYASIIGGIILFANFQMGNLPTGLISVGKWMMIIGMIAIVLTQGRANKKVGAKLGAGLYALYGITGYVGDLVSYSRLMALGLAGGSIAIALNLMIDFLPAGIVGIIGGAVLFILAHTFNLLLGGLGAYVHTCRLEYVEFFSKFYTGGGRAFAPFKSKNQYINVKEN